MFAVLPMGVLLTLVLLYGLPAASDTLRLNAMANSPVCALMGAMMGGLPTLRAYRQ